MKKLLLAAAMLPAMLMAQTPCENGFAGEFPCDNIDLLSFISIEEFETGTTNDIWGWTDPESGNEYALVGLRNGTAFVDVTDPINPIYMGKLNSITLEDGTVVPSTWRDIKVFNDYAFIVSEAAGHGMQVFDLTRLRDYDGTFQNYERNAFYDGFGNAHNIAINEDTGFAYAIGTSTFDGGLHIIDINDPLNPVLAGSFAEGGYIHDSQVVTYAGPDQDYQGREIALNCNGPGNFLDIVDVTDKTDPQRIIAAPYPGEHYIHQGWLSEDHRYFFHNDELDEIQAGHNTHTYVWDLANLDNPLFLGFYDSGLQNTDHNCYTHRNHLWQSNYKAGLRVLHLQDPFTLNLEEVAFFDTHPEDNTAGTDGSWSNYPYFESGTIIVTNIETGLFVLGLSEGFELATKEETSFAAPEISIFPNPTNDVVNISLSERLDVSQLSVIDAQGKVVILENWKQNQLNAQIDVSHLETGLYMLQLGNFQRWISVQ